MRIVLLSILALSLFGCPRFVGGERERPTFSNTIGNAPNTSRTTPPLQHGYDEYVLREIAPTLSTPPPPISGGTMFVGNGRIFVADSDRDKVWVLDEASLTVAETHTLRAGDEPGRVQGSGNRVFVALRGTGELYALATSTRTKVCDRIRGVLTESNRVLVVCAEGSLAVLNEPGNHIDARFSLPEDARDIVATTSGRHFVSTFQGAQVYELARDFSSLRRLNIIRRNLGARSVHTAYRMRVERGSDGLESLVLAVQLESDEELRSLGTPAYYAAQDENGCTSPVVSAVEALHLGSEISTLYTVGNAPVPTDLAVRHTVQTAATGNQPRFLLVSGARQDGQGFTSVNAALSSSGLTPCSESAVQDGDARHLTSIERLSNDRFVAFRRDTAELLVFQDPNAAHIAAVRLSDESKLDLGHSFFFGASRRQVACASCHAEGESDGHVWRFDVGASLTPAIFAGIRNTAPFHWRGDQVSLHALLSNTMVGRMGGPTLGAAAEQSLARWMDEGIPETEPLLQAEQATLANRGETYFRTDGQCASCHSGDLYTDNRNHVVGPDGPVQTPSLVGVRHRTRLLHNGCREGLETFLAGNGGCDQRAAHGNMPSDTNTRATLLAFLRTL